MLARERKRAAWSLTLGVGLAGAIYGYNLLLAGRSQAQLESAVMLCKATPTKDGHPIVKAEESGPSGPSGKFDDFTLNRKLECRPEEVAAHDKSELIPQELRIRDLYDAESAQRADATSEGIAALLLFALPLVWYFLLDRLSEVSAAISGRDPSH